MQTQPPSYAKTTFGDIYDVVVLGGGLAGLTIATQLMKSAHGAKILVLERNRHPVPEAAYKVGESTVEIGARYYAEIIGMKDHLEKQQLRKMGLRYFFPHDGNNELRSRVEVGAAYPPHIPAYQIDRGRFENALALVTKKEGVEFRDDVAVQRVELGPDSHTVVLGNNGRVESAVKSRWVVDASGRAGLLKRQLGLGKTSSHNVNAAWWRIGSPVAIDDWSKDPAWEARVPSRRRILSTNHLMGPGYWVWLIPLASNATSFGIVADPALHPFDTFNTFERSLQWLRKHEPQCAAVVDERRDKLQDFRVMKHCALECTRVFSPDRWAITGEAGLFLDPFYSPGSDFIAISNTYISDLICRDLRGEDIRQRLENYNTQMLSFFRNSLPFYEDQYPIMGNSQVMTAKIVWDTAVYWGALTLLYFHNKMCDLEFMYSIQSQLLGFARLNLRMQTFFREWHELDDRPCADIFVNLQEMRFLNEIYGALTAELDNPGFLDRLNRNLRLLEVFAAHILEAVERTMGDEAGISFPERKVPRSDLRVTGMERIWLFDNLRRELVAMAGERH